MPIKSGEKLDEVMLIYIPAATAIINAVSDSLLECCIIIFIFRCTALFQIILWIMELIMPLA